MKLLLPHRAETMFINNQHGLALLRFQHHMCLTVYEDSNFQVFHNETGNFVYDKKNEKVIELTINGWTRMVLQIVSTLEYPPECDRSVHWVKSR